MYFKRAAFDSQPIAFAANCCKQYAALGWSKSKSKWFKTLLDPTHINVTENIIVVVTPLLCACFEIAEALV